MKIYVKDNVERIACDEETAKKLELKGLKELVPGEKIIPSLIPDKPEKPMPAATENVRRRRRSQKSKVVE